MYPEPGKATPLGCLAVLVGLPAIWGVIFSVYGIIDAAPGLFATLVGCLAVLGVMFRIGLSRERGKGAGRLR